MAPSNDQGSFRAVEMVLELAGEIRDNSLKLAEFGVELASISKTLDGLSKIVKDGNGHSLVTKVAVVEGEVKAIKKTIEVSLDKKIGQLEDRIESAGEEEIRVRREARNQKFQFYGAVVPAVLALVASVLALIYA